MKSRVQPARIGFSSSTCFNTFECDEEQSATADACEVIYIRKRLSFECDEEQSATLKLHKKPSKLLV